MVLAGEKAGCGPFEESKKGCNPSMKGGGPDREAEPEAEPEAEAAVELHADVAVVVSCMTTNSERRR